MYVTRPMSLYRRHPEALREAPPGPGSGYLVMLDEESESQITICCGACRGVYLPELPFPNDRRHTADYDNEEKLKCIFVPVIDQPLSSNRYYVVLGEGKHKGLISTCSTEADKITCCFCRSVGDVNPREFDPEDIYQQVVVVASPAGNSFYAKSASPDGYPQSFLRRKYWRLLHLNKHVYPLTNASGVDDSLRARKPDVNFWGASSPAVVVGRWYCPFVFVREEEMPREDLIERNGYYEMILEQFWEQIYECVNYAGSGRGKTVEVVASVQARRSCLHARGVGEVQVHASAAVGRYVWFRREAARGGGVGLSTVIVERMRWEEERGGWVEKNDVAEAFDGKKGGWHRFTCFVLVERFALKRLDGTLLLTCDFKHANKLHCRKSEKACWMILDLV